VSRFLGRFMDGPLPAMLMLFAMAVGVAALLITPREEEPQIVVPLADVLVSAPGLSAEQVERQVATPLEKLLSQIDGVEYIYSRSQAGHSVVTVRFFVGEDREDSLVKIYNKIFSNSDAIPAAIDAWVVKPVEVDDVPIVVAALWSDSPGRTGDYELRRIAEEIEHKLQSITATNRVTVTGGRSRRIRVELDHEALAARSTVPLEVAWAIDVSNKLIPAGRVARRDQNLVVEAGTFIRDAAELRRLVVNVVGGAPVYLGDVARVLDGPAEPGDYTWIAFGPSAGDNSHPDGVYPAVFLSVAKRKGANAVSVARDVIRYLHTLEAELFPPEVHVTIIRDYGGTADEKVGDLVASLAAAVLTVVIFIGVFLGWRPALVVGLAVPICYGATLGLDFMAGYTINRVTLFALILSLGLLVDDPITGVDNIERYLSMGRHRKRDAVLLAMAEIRGALIMSTIAIIIAFAPLFGITGMMGPYMAPLAFNVPVSVSVSTVVAFFITPWLAVRLLRREAPEEGYDPQRTVAYRSYARLLRPLIATRPRAWSFVALVALLFFVAAALPAFRLVPLKLLPYDNKNEFQIVIDMPEGTTLERTESAVRAIGHYLRGVPEVDAIAAFVGVPSPMDFNGLVRQYYLREGPHLADLRVTLIDKREREQQSHGILLRVRADLEALARVHDARIKLVEVPPGPPVVATVAAELYADQGVPYSRLREAARMLAARMEREPFVVDVDTSVEDDEQRIVFVTDKEKAALSGIGTDDIARTIAMAMNGTVVGYMQDPNEVNPLPIELRLPHARRSSASDLRSLHVKGRAGITKIREKGGVRDAPQPLVQLGELGRVQRTLVDKSIFHKNLKRVAYVFADIAGRTPADVVLDVNADLGADPGAGSDPRPLAARSYLDMGGGDGWQLPAGVRVVWDGEGEWDISLRVFRDLGIGFAAALLGIFAVLMVQTGMGALTGIIMLAIPLSVIGIMPGFWLLNQIGERIIAGYPNLILFTATAMIGMIALAGIVVRNSLVLVEFVHLSLAEGLALSEALVRAGATRMRPVFLTAGTTLLGNLVITLDPIFSGLAWAIIFGIGASTLFTLAVIPVVYFLVYDRRPGHGLRSPHKVRT
jgi:multidrug efflux pump subunit AcrB